MLNIVLLCQYGASTGMLAKRIEDAAKKRDVDAIVNAYSVTQVGEVVSSADIVLLGPQMRYQLKDFENRYADKQVPFLVIDTVDYGMMNGDKVLDSVLKIIKDDDRSEKDE